MLDAHVVAHGVGVREVARAAGHRAHGAVARVVRVQVPPRRRQRAQRAAAQRALQPRRRRPAPGPGLHPAPHAHLAYRRLCQRVPRRGICNADSTKLLNVESDWQIRRLALPPTTTQRLSR